MRFSAALVFAGYIGTSAAFAEESAAVPSWQSISTVETLQARVAKGSREASAALPKLIVRIGDQFLKSPPSTWDNRRNARALGIYLFNGGDPAVARKILQTANLAADDIQIIRVAIAHLEGNEAEARQLVEGIDPNSLPPDLGAHIALIKASFLAAKNRTKALEMLDLARLLMPGTLVEEVSLRREMFIVSDGVWNDRFLDIARRYKQRFRTSVYTDNFDQRFEPALIRFWIGENSEIRTRLDETLRELPAADRDRLYLSIARKALTEGKPQLTLDASSRLSSGSTLNAAFKRSGDLYTAIAGMFSGVYDSSYAALRDADVSMLDARDREIRTAAMMIADNIRRPAEAAFRPDEGSDASKRQADGPAFQAAASDIKRASLLLRDGAQ